MNIGLIVEGHGEVAAAPELVRRLAAAFEYYGPLTLPRPFRLPRGRIVQEAELKNAADFMARRTAPDGHILVLFDADDDCPATLGPTIGRWIRERLPENRSSVVLAKCEFETWFIAAARSLAGKRGLPHDFAPPAHPESINDAKGWFGNRVDGGYSPTTDQAAFAALMALDEAREAESFDKLYREMGHLFTAAHS